MKLSILCLRDHYRLVVVGGGAAGCAVASKFSRILPREQIAVLEPKNEHLYQPGLTLVAGGKMEVDQLRRDQRSVLPRGVDWRQNGVSSLMPEQNKIELQDGSSISYDFLVLATGLELRYEMIEGLPHGRQSVLEAPNVCSIYFPQGALKTREELTKFSAGGTALFTFPATPIKCAGAPQKICYMADDLFRSRNVRSGSRVIYCTTLGRIFAIPKYAEALERLVKERDIEVNTRMNLVKVNQAKREATFVVLDADGVPTEEQHTIQYSLLHIGPPCSPVDLLRAHAQKQKDTGVTESQQLTDAQGWVKVNPLTLQSPTFPNVFAIGDCANTLNAKTAAAISSQLKAVGQNLRAVMTGKQPTAEYDGYASCPLVVGGKHAILAEYSPKGPLETFPFDQSRPSRFVYLMKRHVMPPLYWWFLLRGFWEGPATMRRISNALLRIVGQSK